MIHVVDPDDERLADYRNVPDAELVERRKGSRNPGKGRTGREEWT